MSNLHINDILAGLSDDCLLDIFVRLDHNDLDEIATLSQRCRKLSDSARSKAVKLPAARLGFLQICKGYLYLTMLNSKYCARFLETRKRQIQEKNDTATLNIRGLIDGSNMSSLDYENKIKIRRRRARSDSEPMPFVNDCPALIDQALQIVQRFRFKYFFFLSFVLDDQFLEWLEKIVTISPTKDFYFAYILREDYERDDRELRLLSIILSAKITTLTLNFTSPAPFIDEKFLISFGQNAPLGFLAVCSSDQHQSGCLLRASEEFENLLSNFGTFIMIRLARSTNLLIKSLVERLRHKKVGFWKFRITESTTKREIIASLGPKLKYTLCANNKHKIELRRSIHKVVFLSSKDEQIPTLWKFVANFC